MTINSNGTVTIGSWSQDVSFTINMTGSNSTADIKNIPSGSWTGLNTSSLSDLRLLVAQNIGTGTIQIARDSAGTKLLVNMAPGDGVLLTDSGSIATKTLFAQTTDVASTLSYIVAES